MEYKIIGRVEDQHGLVGYAIVQRQGDLKIIDKKLAVSLAVRNQLYNIKYNDKMKQLVSTDKSQNLKGLKVITLQECFSYLNTINEYSKQGVSLGNQVSNNSNNNANSNQTASNNTTNIEKKPEKPLTKVEKAKEWLKTNNDLEMRFYEREDDVILDNVRRLNQDKEMIIPEFITSIERRATIYTTYDPHTSFSWGDYLKVIIKGQDKDFGLLDLSKGQIDLKGKTSEIIIEDACRITQLRGLCQNNINIEHLKITVLSGDFRNLDKYGFCCLCDGCKKLKSFEFINKQTNAKPLDRNKTFRLDSIFHDCENLETVKLDGMRDILGQTTQIFKAFYDCKKIKAIGLRALTSPRLFEISFAFLCCWKLEQLDLDGIPQDLDIENRLDVVGGCGRLKFLNIKNDTLRRAFERALDTTFSRKYILDDFGY